MKPKRYIGDGVYAEVDNGDLILTTEDGISTQNKIVLEPEVLGALFVYLGQTTSQVDNSQE